MCFASQFWETLLVLSRRRRPMPPEASNLTSGIAFFIDIFAPSDQGHAFHDLRQLMPTLTGDEQLTEQEVIDRRSHITSTHHGWQNGARTRLPFYYAVQRVFGREMLDFESRNAFTDIIVHAIYGSYSQTRTFGIIRHIELGRQFQRTIHPGLIEWLVGLCPRLEGLRLEQWRQPSAHKFEEVRQGMYSQLFIKTKKMVYFG